MSIGNVETLITSSLSGDHYLGYQSLIFISMVAETLTQKQISSNRCIVFRQGMGIYLFGELIISQQSKHRALVDEVLVEIGAEMDRCTYQTVKDMLEGKE